jgi:two-component system, cell cycle response regulator DivK
VSGQPLILLVDDNSSNQLLVQAVLEPAGYHVEVASTASQALDRLKTMTPEMILMDLELPGKDGLSLTRLLKSMGPTTGIPVVAMTSHTSLQTRADALAAGCTAFISKPIDIHALPGRIAGILAGSHE